MRVSPANKDQSTGLPELSRSSPLEKARYVAEEILDVEDLEELVAEGVADKCVNQNVRRRVYHLGGDSL